MAPVRFPDRQTSAAFVGVCNGFFFVVRLDALLQRQGAAVVGVGPAIAIQNFFENFGMLLLVSADTVASYVGLPVNDLAAGVGLFIALSIGALTLTGALCLLAHRRTNLPAGTFL
jgi:hypothetical protein